MSKNNPIVKLTYKRETFNLLEMRFGEKTITTITDGGDVVIKKYHPNCRKAYSVERTTCSIKKFQELCNSLEDCIDTANNCHFYIDDSEEELKLFYKYNRVQIVDRGLGNDNTIICILMYDFLHKLGIEKY